MGKKFCKIGSKWCKFCRHGNCDFSKTPTESLANCPRIEAIKTVQLADLLTQVSFELVFKSLISYFPDQESSKEGYQEVFEYLKTLTPKPINNLKDLFITVNVVEEYGKNYLDVFGTRVIGNTKSKYGIEFEPWKNWVSMYIAKDTLNNFKIEDIVAGCLYELTFFGFNEQGIQNKLQDLKDSIEECKNN